MGSIYHFPEGQIIAFVLVLFRILAFVIAWPIFGVSAVPTPVKILLALTLTLMVFPTVHFSNSTVIQINEEIIFMAIKELLVGLILAFIMRMFFFTISSAGDIISISMGLGSAQLFNPAMGSQGNVVEQLQVLIATMFFLAINGHHLFISGLAQSFEVIPVSVMALKTENFHLIAGLGSQVILLTLKIAAPVLVAIFLTNIAMGVLGRAVPQINVLVTSMPVTILLGLGVLFITTPLFIVEMSGLLDVMTQKFFLVMKGL